MEDISLFFRDDDLGMDMPSFNKLMDLFCQNNHKLNAASVPKYIQETDVKHLVDLQNLEVHTHGFSHNNYQTSGKKAEFGNERTSNEILIDLIDGKNIIEAKFPRNNFAAFTPPWNRIDESHYLLLEKANFKILSRDGNKKSNLENVKDLNIDIDLHTAKPAFNLSHEQLLQKIFEVSKKQKHVGVMLHHKHMNENDFIYLDQFLKILNEKKIKTKFYSEIYKELGTK